MASCNVILKSSVHRDLQALPGDVVRRVWQRIRSLAADPSPRGSVKLSGSDGLYRLRVGDYRIVYGWNPASREVVVHAVRHRREVYR